jgi:hypothetical protein
MRKMMADKALVRLPSMHGLACACMLALNNQRQHNNKDNNKNKNTHANTSSYKRTKTLKIDSHST